LLALPQRIVVGHFPRLCNDLSCPHLSWRIDNALYCKKTCKRVLYGQKCLKPERKGEIDE
jgi:hypothetical protein